MGMSLSSPYQTTGQEGAYIEQASASTHHEPCLVEVGNAGSVIVRLSVVQVRARIRHVHHGGKVRVPRAPLHGSYLTHSGKSGRVQDKRVN
jgi:hypothetical protein